jgi:hypothetical protein
MLYCLLVIVFFATFASGPAGRELVVDPIMRRRAARLELESSPPARVIYLPTAACRPPSEQASWGGVLDAIE